MNLILVGYMASGKSTIGKNIAKVLNYKFIDLDKKGKINLNKVIFKTIKFNEINKGFKMFKSSKTTGRILIKF